jgi:hypothetical protein
MRRADPFDYSISLAHCGSSLLTTNGRTPSREKVEDSELQAKKIGSLHVHASVCLRLIESNIGLTPLEKYTKKIGRRAFSLQKS